MVSQWGGGLCGEVSLMMILCVWLVLKSCSPIYTAPFQIPNYSIITTSSQLSGMEHLIISYIMFSLSCKNSIKKLKINFLKIFQNYI